MSEEVHSRKRRKTQPPRRSICPDQQEGCLLLSTLPEDLVTVVLSRLAYHDRVRCLSVCRKWSSLISSPAFKNLCAHLPMAAGDIHFPVIGKGRVWFGFDMAWQKWRRMPSLTFLPVDACLVGKQLFCILSSHRGLLCVRHVQGRDKQSIFVCNPMTKTYKELPAMLGCRRPGALHLQVAQDGKSYSLVAVTCCQHTSAPMPDADYGLARVEVYDSISGAWTLLPSSGMPTPGMLFASPAQSVLHNGLVYFLAYHRINERWSQTCLVGYHPGRRSWTRPCVVPDSCNGPLLLVCGGEVMLLQANKLRIGQPLDIYRLEEKAGRWTLETRTPTLHSPSCPLSEWDRFSVVAHEHFICLTTLTSRQVVVYDSRSRSWESWPKFPCTWTSGFYNPPSMTYEYGATTRV